MDTDRKVITILMAKKLRDMLDEFVADNADAVAAHLEMSSEEFKGYLLNRVPEAINVVKSHLSKEK